MSGRCPDCGRPKRRPHLDRPAVFEAQGPGFPPADLSKLLRPVTAEDVLAISDWSGGWFSQQRDEFLAQQRPGDAIWAYNTMGEVPLSGSAGFYLMRDGYVVAALVTMMS